MTISLSPSPEQRRSSEAASNIRDIYLGMKSGAERTPIPFKDDPATLALIENRHKEDVLNAARYIVEMVGRETTDTLREAVVPENLTDVLILGGAGFETLMMIGERTLLDRVIERRNRDMREITEKIKPHLEKKTGVTSTLGFLWGKATKLDADLQKLEGKISWKKPDIMQYLALGNELSEKLAKIREALPD